MTDYLRRDSSRKEGDSLYQTRELSERQSVRESEILVADHNFDDSLETPQNISIDQPVDALMDRRMFLHIKDAVRSALTRRFLLCIAIGSVTACASEEIGIVEHGISVLNKGPTPISGVLVDYGELKRTFCVPHCLPRQGGGGWNAPMPIQKEIQVSWRTQDGQQHEAKVPVRDKLKDAKRLRTIYLHFYGASLIVIQGLEYSNPTIVGREVFPLHP